MLFRYATASIFLCAAAFAATASVSAPSAEAASFADTASASYDDAVQVLVDEGIVQGCGDDRFCPHRALNRGQLASVLVSALQLPASDVDHFGDDDGNVHESSIDALAEAGITSGCAAEEFCAEEPVTRGQIASMLARSFDPPPTDETFFDDTSGGHADAIDRLASAGIAAGCGDPLTAFCPGDSVLRWHTAVFVARAMGLTEQIEITSLEERRAQQEIVDAEEQKRLEEERARREAEEQEQERLAAEAEAERYAKWDRLAQCESGGNWSINTGNGYYGGLQFSLSSWRAVGGSGYPHQHSREEQIHRGERLLALQGWGAWPACSRKLGYR